MENLNIIIGKINTVLYFPILVVLLIAVGLYFTIRTGFIQVSLLKEAFKVIKEKPKDESDVSSFQALMISTASRVGTGNIVGVSSAICLGGYGAVFWMWLVAIIGSASAFAESTLAQIYKKKGKHSSYGGPSYYIEEGLKSRKLGVVFSIALIVCYAVGFNMLASFNLQSSFQSYGIYNPQVSPKIIGGFFALAVAFVILGGGKRIIKITQSLVPFMGIIFVLVSLIMIGLNIGRIPEVFRKIIEDAFNFKAIFSGLAGSSMILGMKRGLYSNEAGIGSAPNAAAAAEVSHPVKQGLVQMLSVFIDTLLICSATAFMGLSSGIDPSPALEGAPFIQEALASVFGNLGYYFISASLVLFGFTTFIGNLYYVDSNFDYLAKKELDEKQRIPYRIIAAFLIFFGAIQEQAFVWNLSDLFMGIMALINLPTILILSNKLIACLKDYKAQRKEGKDPSFVAKNIGIKEELDYWK
ncbi:alanine/glycine:cation symporter family protein [uncultured Anaerococcus sp.]|uniref:alanine/glycine:cation symporter family protein n=1 Tax=uncultured Anaerococcus sp. TaxID=293428 RepID=UPI002804D88F|nr:alanine/glycine:cation symporter family protein [uncultured Anaerococcus sp.]MDU3136962.1 alanine/glycine:cation symporter family protein [Anaerococcus prevotii]